MSEGGMARGLTEGSRAAAAAAAPPLAADTNQDDLSGNEPCEHVWYSGAACIFNHLWVHNISATDRAALRVCGAFDGVAPGVPTNF